MELISKISRGSRMDQIYIPKIRNGFSAGSYVVITPLETEKIKEKLKTEKTKPYFYNIRVLEPIKLEIIEKLMEMINSQTECENIIITGSFLEKGFNFNDIDIVILNEKEIDIKKIKETADNLLGIKNHIIAIDNKSFLKGLCADPLYQMMLSKYISKKRIIYKIKNKINYKLLDLQLLKSKTLIDNFDILDGNEKYYLVRNMLSISLFLEDSKINNENLEKEINQIFDTKSEKIKQNLLEKNSFLKNYKKVFNKIFNKIMKGIKNGSEQK